jgi:hypothetical protein
VKKKKPKDWTRAAMELPARMPDGVSHAPHDLLSAYQQIVLPQLERATYRLGNASKIDEAVREMVVLELALKQALAVLR